MPTAAAQDSLIGSTLVDKFRILRIIGRGGMGVVYEAEHVELGKRVAIKLVLEKYADDGEALRRFKREALAASKIGNAHIIDVQDVGAAPDGRPFVVMELLSGAPLSKVLEASGPMPAWRAIPIMRQVLRAVGAAHAKGIVHRDLKPDNIFLLDQEDNHDFVKLLDFGISKIMTDSTPGHVPTRLTTTGVVMGTPLYMAPEQAMGAPVDHQVDIYACGVILYELLSGRPPFDATTYPVLIAQLLTAQPKPITDHVPGLPGTIAQAVHRALEKEPANRFANAEQFAQALGKERTASQMELGSTIDSAKHLALASTQPTPAGGIPGTPGVKARPSAPTLGQTAQTRPRWMMPAVIGGLVIAIGGGVLFATRGRGAPEPPVAPPTPAVNAGSGAITATPLTGLYELATVPGQARVTIDGKDEGRSPLVITLPVGTHHVKIELEGFETIITDESIAAGDHLKEKQALTAVTNTPPPPTKAAPQVKSTPQVKSAPGGARAPVVKFTPPVTGQKYIPPVFTPPANNVPSSDSGTKPKPVPTGKNNPFDGSGSAP